VDLYIQQTREGGQNEMEKKGGELFETAEGGKGRLAVTDEVIFENRAKLKEGKH